MPLANPQIAEAVMRAWRDAFPEAPAELESNFFELEGDSFAAFQIVATVVDDLGLSDTTEELMLLAIFDYPTPRALTDYIASLTADIGGPPRLK